MLERCLIVEKGMESIGVDLTSGISLGSLLALYPI